MQEPQLIIFGKHPALAVINNARRNIHQIFISEGRKTEYKKLLQNNLVNSLVNSKLGDKIEYVSTLKLDRLCGSSSLHQGIAVLTDRLPNYSVDFLLNELRAKSQSLVVILDKISDPFNFGNILRSCKAFGADFIISQDKYSPKESSTIAKTASGALEDIPISNINNLSLALGILKEHNYFCYGLDCYTKHNINNIKFENKTALIIGSEGEGIRDSLLKKCDFLIKIPMKDTRAFDSLNVSNAAAIAMNYYFCQTS